VKTIGICNNKGGVGKTTICFCLAGALAEMGKKVLLVDMDPQGSLSSSFISDIYSLPCSITDVLLDDHTSIKKLSKRLILKTSTLFQPTSVSGESRTSFSLSGMRTTTLLTSLRRSGENTT